MTSAVRWAAIRAILMFHNCEGQSHKTVSTNHNFWRERRAEAVSNRSPSAYQPNALPLAKPALATVSWTFIYVHIGPWWHGWVTVTSVQSWPAAWHSSRETAAPSTERTLCADGQHSLSTAKLKPNRIAPRPEPCMKVEVAVLGSHHIVQELYESWGGRPAELSVLTSLLVFGGRKELLNRASALVTTCP